MHALENVLQLNKCMRRISLQVLCEITSLDKSLNRNTNRRGQLILMKKKKRDWLCQAIVPTSKRKKNIKKYSVGTL